MNVSLYSVHYINCIRFWPAIDSALREAACARKVEVNLLVSCWSHSPEAMFIFLQSLSVLNKTPLGCTIHVVCQRFPNCVLKYFLIQLFSRMSTTLFKFSLLHFSRKFLRFLIRLRNIRSLLLMSTMPSIW